MAAFSVKDNLYKRPNTNATILSSRRQRGAAAVEFTLIFMVLFLLFYGLVGYTMPLLLAATFQDLAASSLRDVVELRAYADEDMDYQARVVEQISRSWIPEKWRQPCPDYQGHFLDNGGAIWRVCVRIDDPTRIIPPLNLLGVSVPDLPGEIRGEAMIQLR